MEAHVEPNFCSSDFFGPTYATATRHSRLLVLLMPAFSVLRSVCHGLFTFTCCQVASESATILTLLSLFVRFGLSCAGLCLQELWCCLRISNFVSYPLVGWMPWFGLLSVHQYVSSSASVVVRFFAALSVQRELLLGFWFWQLPIYGFALPAC